THSVDARIAFESLSPETLTRGAHALGFGARDALHARLPGGRSAGADLHHDHGVLVARDDVELEVSEPDVGIEDHQPARAKIASYDLFGLSAGPVCRLLAGLSDRCSFRSCRPYRPRSSR